MPTPATPAVPETPAAPNATTALARIGYSTIYGLPGNIPSFFYEAGMMIDADGAYKAYHPDKVSGLDYLGNAGKPGNWWALVTDNGKASGKPLVQKAGDPAPGFYISTTSLEDKSKTKSNPLRYVDSSSIPYIVLPGNKTFGAALSDLCIVYNPVNQKLCGGVFADTGPKNQIGEASIAMANGVGIPSSPKHGGQGHGLIYLVFPGSTAGWPLMPADIQQKANEAFTKWGGLNRLQQIITQG
jgi:hypothetical protein